MKNGEPMTTSEVVIKKKPNKHKQPNYKKHKFITPMYQPYSQM